MSFPSHKSDRRIIVVLDDHSYTTERELSKSRKTLFDQVGVTCLPYSIIKSEGEVHDALQTIIDDDLISEGQILIQNPYDRDRYVPMVYAQKNLFLEKWQLFSALCGILGAKTVSVENIETLEEENNREGNFEASTLNYGASVDGKNASQYKISKSDFLENKFSGSCPDIHEAENFLCSHYLKSDFNLGALVKMRGGGNPLKEHALQITLGEEFKDRFDLAVALKLPILSGEASYKRATSRLQKSILKVKVTF